MIKISNVFTFRARIIEIPLVEFVKESAGRGVRAKDNAETSHLQSASRWFVGMGASFIFGLIIVLAIHEVSPLFGRVKNVNSNLDNPLLQVKKRLSRNYSRVPLSIPDEDHENGLEKNLLSTSDLDDDDSDNSFPKV